MNKLSKTHTIIRSKPVYTLGVASTLTGIPKPSIIQYISKGLIIPYKKETKRNLFSDVDLTRLKIIRSQLEHEGLNVAGIKALSALIPCWSIRNCSEDDRNGCDAYASNTLPCWEASDKGNNCKNQDCRQCDVYLYMETYSNLKDLIKDKIN